MFQSLADQRITMADVMSSKHSVVTLTDENILDITNKTVKIEQEKIINDVKKREIPRFKYDPPAQSVATATQQLLKFADQVRERQPRRQLLILLFTDESGQLRGAGASPRERLQDTGPRPCHLRPEDDGHQGED